MIRSPSGKRNVERRKDNRNGKGLGKGERRMRSELRRYEKTKRRKDAETRGKEHKNNEK